MSGIVAGLARKLDFGDSPTTVTGTARGRAGLRLAPRAGDGDMVGPGKYRVLAHRRRVAQMQARHILDGLEPSRGGASRERLTGGGRLLREVR